jgi:hypothetical protein
MVSSSFLAPFSFVISVEKQEREREIEKLARTDADAHQGEQKEVKLKGSCQSYYTRSKVNG